MGTTAYTADQLIAILGSSTATPGPGANAVMILAQQLIAARLNQLNGASVAPISSVLTSADTLLAGLVIPPVGSANVSPASDLGEEMTGLAQLLDGYNNGELSVPHCE